MPFSKASLLFCIKLEPPGESDIDIPGRFESPGLAKGGFTGRGIVRVRPWHDVGVVVVIE